MTSGSLSNMHALTVDEPQAGRCASSGQSQLPWKRWGNKGTEWENE